MSTVTTYEGPVIHLAVNYQPATNHVTHVTHTDVHTSSEDIGVTVSAKLQVSDRARGGTGDRDGGDGSH